MDELEEIIYKEVHYTKVPCSECSMTEGYEVVECERVNRILMAIKQDLELRD